MMPILQSNTTSSGQESHKRKVLAAKQEHYGKIPIPKKPRFTTGYANQDNVRRRESKAPLDRFELAFDSTFRWKDSHFGNHRTAHLRETADNVNQ